MRLGKKKQNPYDIGILDEVGIESKKKVEDISTQLPYVCIDECDSEGDKVEFQSSDTRGYTISRDHRVSMGFEITCPDVRHYSQQEGDELHEGLIGLIDRLQDGETMQFRWIPIDIMDPVFENYLEEESAGSAFTKREKAKRLAMFKERFKNGQMRTFFNSMYLISNESLKMDSYTNKSKGFFGRMAEFLDWSGWDSSIIMNEQLKPHLRDHCMRMESIESGINQIPGFEARKLSSPDIIRQCKRLIGSNDWREEFAYNIDLFNPEVELDSFGAHLIGGGGMFNGSHFLWKKPFYHKIFSFDKWPKKGDVGHLVTSICNGNVLKVSQNVEIILNVRPGNAKAELSRIDVQENILMNMYRDNPDKNKHMLEPGGVIYEIKRKKDELINSPELNSCEVEIYIHIWEKDHRKIELALEEIRAKFRQLLTGCNLEEEQVATMRLLFQNMPGVAKKKAEYGRDIRLNSKQVATLVPVLGQGIGVVSSKEPRVPILLETTSGTPFGICLASDRTPNGHGVLTGGSGMGKTTMANLLIESYVGRKAQVIIIDGSTGERGYKNACYLHGGTYIDSKYESNMLFASEESIQKGKLNPDELAENMTVLECAIMRNENDVIDNIRRSVLRKSLNLLYEMKKGDIANPPIPYDLVELVLTRYNGDNDEENAIAAEIAMILKSNYTHHGGENVYAKNNDVKKSHMPNSDFIVHDLKEDLSKPDYIMVRIAKIYRDIQRAVRHNMERPASEKREIIVLMDEAWKLYGKEVLYEKLIGLVKDGRGRGLNTWLASQELSELMQVITKVNESGKRTSPIINSSCHFITAGLSNDEAELYGECFNLPRVVWEKLKKLELKPGEYGEYGYICKTGTGMIFNELRYRPTQAQLDAYSTKPKDAAIFKDGVRTITAKLNSNSKARKTLIDGMVQDGWDRSELDKLSNSRLAVYGQIFHK